MFPLYPGALNFTVALEPITCFLNTTGSARWFYFFMDFLGVLIY